MAESESKVLMLIDDEPAQSRLISALAAREGWRTLVVGDADTALATLNSRDGVNVSAILLDQWVPGDAACDLIRDLKSLRPALPILMLTASASPLLAVEAMRAGATDYLIKPIAPDRFLQALRSATERETPRDELQPLSEKMSAALDFDAMIGNAPKFRGALAQAAKAARGQGHVLVEGESGVGKEMILRAMHASSPRAKAPLRTINVGGVPINSIESLLFGHERNAFPGAFERQVGVLQNCDGGTVILDDVDRLAISTQEKLAETLANKIVRPIGATHGFRVDVRVLCASNFNLTEIAQGGQFSRPLLDQIGATRIALPPLRERASDIPALTRHFLARIGEQPGLAHHSITDSALKLLASYDWPGNVRQLQAALFRAAVFCDEEALTSNSFPQLSEILGNVEDQSNYRQEGAGVLLYTADGNLRPLEEIEADVIRLAIGHYSGRMTEVARRLGIGRSTLYRKLSTLGIDSAA
ncbi:sigma-54-dependent transcriptional regulator [Qipengyuania atrilutea]|uniref:DNA-binding transcriptional regulator NtrC n=1 Tax=Qipengyuania atrilutea TaxID=2744473 RepID=A0A850H4U5_9SPHN|nr:sigma-54 dependent transcriptional regulator [Actirhodobacter atriluteus]NVD45676.1 sigma-54-dependent Fis family transcriptional regulator [Actirhodobacter atriluteus]